MRHSEFRRSRNFGRVFIVLERDTAHPNARTFTVGIRRGAGVSLSWAWRA